MGADANFVWPRVAVIGTGAVGCYFGGVLARAGAKVKLIGRNAGVDEIARAGLTIQDSKVRDCAILMSQERIRVEATTDIEAARHADVVLLCVKTIDTGRASIELARRLSAEAIVVSMQNGVDNVERIFETSKISALPAVIYLSVEMSGVTQVNIAGEAKVISGVPHHLESTSRNRREDVSRLAQMFSAAGIACEVSDNIAGEMWLKLLWNCAGNAVTALGRATYGRVSASPLVRETMLAAALEVKRVAEAAGIVVPELVLTDDVIRKAHDAGNLTSSTAQDVMRKRRTEIDSLNGYVVSRAKELGIDVPVNQALYALVKLLESSYSTSKQ
ncbi:MAG TPA: 2-dehydropantoate 2-reductase [Candidatus Sulfotelmatobacter sp.]|nr:2-dehydropantoate 2-reductase [Candidatus Sulfotelmatobacter sp.]